MSSVTLPLWSFILLLIAAVYAVLVSVLFPGVRWFIRRRLNKALDRLNANLQIKIRPFQRTKRQILIEQLMFDQQVLDTIEQEAQAGNIPREVLQQQVKRYAREIVPSFNAYVYFRLGYWLAKFVSRFVYRVKVAAADVKALQQVDLEATVVFVMNHRSNMDYVLISYLVSEQVTLSYAVGEWARVFPLEMLIRAMGAFFVRRGSQNTLYRKVLERYVAMATKRGVCQAVFLEGGLSRDGHLGQAKLGFLDYILRNFDWQQDRDVVFIPIGINYDFVLEDRNLINWDNKHQRPTTWQHIQRFGRFLRDNLFINSRRRWKKHGYASANFGIPISMRQYCQHNLVDFNHLPKTERFIKVEQLATELMTALQYVLPVLPVPVICLVMLRHSNHAQTAIEIVAQCDEAIDAIISEGAAMRSDQKPKPKTLGNALDMLVARSLLLESDGLYTLNPQQLGLVRYYANSIAHWRSDITDADFTKSEDVSEPTARQSEKPLLSE